MYHVRTPYFFSRCDIESKRRCLGGRGGDARGAKNVAGTVVNTCADMSLISYSHDSNANVNVRALFVLQAISIPIFLIILRTISINNAMRGGNSKGRDAGNVGLRWRGFPFVARGGGVNYSTAWCVQKMPRFLGKMHLMGTVRVAPRREYVVRVLGVFGASPSAMAIHTVCHLVICSLPSID